MYITYTEKGNSALDIDSIIDIIMGEEIHLTI